ncbi:MAG: flavodoxin family protein [Thermoplasmata archaeon]|nr:flavodoxin family protein [Thermoplasmata archaeon]
MKALLINGSPRAKGCTFTALTEVADELARQGIESEIIQVKQDTPGCRACGYCAKKGKCVMDDQVNEVGARLDEFDAVILGSPVYYAGPSGQICAFADRFFYSNAPRFAGKLGACVVSCRRGGASAAFDRLNKYFTITNMPVVSSQYWNQVHGNTPDEVRQDLEGLQTMRTLARNTAWLLKCVEAADAAGVPRPEREPFVRTNFIRGERAWTSGRS